MPSASDRMATVENSTLRRSPRTARRRSPSNVIMIRGLDGGRRPTVVERERVATDGTRNVLGRRALPAGRLAALGATTNFGDATLVAKIRRPPRGFYSAV